METYHPLYQKTFHIECRKDLAEKSLTDEAFDIASRMCRKNPLGLRLTKEAINCNLDAAGFEQALNVEDRNQALCMAMIRYEGHPFDTR